MPPYNISPLLGPILRETRDLSSALNELRWLREHVKEKWEPTSGVKEKTKRILQLCQRRALGVPLQYLLGSQPFGTLDIKCLPGVLIPRPETEAYTTHLAEIIKAKYLAPKSPKAAESSPKPFRIIDFCSGSGCISLLLHSLLSKQYSNLEIIGIDVSPKALELSKENLQYNGERGLLEKSALNQVHFEHANMLREYQRILEICKQTCDIIISNPPYISQAAFNKETSRSVRNWEPRLALVPEATKPALSLLKDSSTEKSHMHPEDIFYRGLIRFHRRLKSKILVMEVGDAAQAMRVVALQMAMRRRSEIEIWRDWPDGQKADDEADHIDINGHRVDVKGTGTMRAVVLYARQPRRQTKEVRVRYVGMKKELGYDPRKKLRNPSRDSPDL
ncbi:family methyltransferase protein [Rutstroemia sp. NJR-2017a BVV2]|nr:family methyltransferase protein [Rutstroemia sp. NJR-2017a BVV2]